MWGVGEGDAVLAERADNTRAGPRAASDYTSQHQPHR